MDAAAFGPDSPGTLMPVEGTFAFVPHPIPRRVSLDPQTQRLLSAADHAVGALGGIIAQLLHPHLVARPLLRREAILSSRIEGTYTTPQDLVMVEAKERPPVPLEMREEDAIEVKNYVQAMDYALARKDEIPVSLRLIREVHQRLLAGVRGERERPGEFRTVQNYIGRPGDPITAARFVPPPVSEMTQALNDFEVYIHEETQETPPHLVRLALIHYQFETIHPFRDGNGRLGRLLLPLLLCSWERTPAPTLYLSSYFELHRQEYMDLLLQVSQRGAWKSWIDFFLRSVAWCANESREQAQGLMRLRDNYRTQFRAARSSALLQTLVDDLFRSPMTSIGQAAELLQVSYVTASNHIKTLEGAGILQEITGRQRDRFYVAPGILLFSRAAQQAPVAPQSDLVETRVVSDSQAKEPD